MNHYIVGGTVLALTAVLLLLMWWGWARRKHQSSQVQPRREWPAGAEQSLETFTIDYVATTWPDDRLNRILVPGLVYPGSALLDIRGAGLSVAVVGESPVVIMNDQVREVDLTSWTIDRAVEPNGIIVVTWELDHTMISSFFRASDHESQARLVSQIERIISQTHHHHA